MNEKYKEMLENAKAVSENSYSPYSNFPVGACALFESMKTYTGTNVENASYGLTFCAERNAIAKAIASGEKSKLVAIAVYSPKTQLCFPCGGCRQWISEFAKDRDAKIILEDKNHEPKIFTLDELMPHAFDL